MRKTFSALCHIGRDLSCSGETHGSHDDFGLSGASWGRVRARNLHAKSTPQRCPDCKYVINYWFLRLKRHPKFDSGLIPLAFYMITHRSSPGKRIDAFPRRPAKLLFVGSRLARADFSFDFVRAQLALAPAMLISVAVLAVQRSGVLFPPTVLDPLPLEPRENARKF